MRKICVFGDNIIECERIIDLIKINTEFKREIYYGINGSTLEYILKFTSEDIKFVLYPGFKRWDKNILNLIKKENNFLQETPDILLTEANEDEVETPIIAVEFCSAIQAGNQAWQRSGRALSISNSNIPYLYITEIGKYEINTNTRERISVRLPNIAVPLSYYFSCKNSSSFIAQCFFKSEEFSKTLGDTFKTFDENIFSENQVSNYVVNKILKKDTKSSEALIFNKLELMIDFLDSTNTNKDKLDMKRALKEEDFLKFCKTESKETFNKTIAAKSKVGNIEAVISLTSRDSVSIIKKDLPFGLIPKKNLTKYIDDLKKIYSIEIDGIDLNKDLAICILKGFKPKGDDNRPDRGALALLRKLSGKKDLQIMTVIYGPILKGNYNLLISNCDKLCDKNGLWRSFLTLSNFLLVDSLILDGENKTLTQNFICNDKFCKNILENKSKDFNEIKTISPNVKELKEDDVDTVIHYVFKNLIPNTFESFCNPPGGDWSGIVFKNLKNDYFKWLSLNRVSSSGKRPDHVIQLYNVKGKNYILVIESKGKGSDLEENIGESLKNYLKDLAAFKSSVIKTPGTDWSINNINNFYIEDFKIISVGAFLENKKNVLNEINNTAKCDILISVNLIDRLLTINGFSLEGKKVANHLLSNEYYQV